MKQDSGDPPKIVYVDCVSVMKILKVILDRNSKVERRNSSNLTQKFYQHPVSQRNAID